MKKLIFRVCLATSAIILFQSASAQTKTNTAILRQASIEQAEKERTTYQRLEILARQKGWKMVLKRPNGGTAILVGTDDFGIPLYLTTDNNIAAAATISTNKLWPGGSTGLNLNGSSNSVRSKMAVWDGGRVRPTHVELTGRILQKDVPVSTSDHSTHVAGTMIASGVNPIARGMSFGQQQLIAYDYGNHLSEMLNESPNLLISNHSYGTISGWSFNDVENRWEFWGVFGANEDYKFGYYSSDTQLMDSIAYNAPYYLIVKSAGNHRDVNGPAVGQPYWRYNASGVMADAGVRPAGISSNDGYDIIATYGTAKNILTVGAVEPIEGGYTGANNVLLGDFSSWGPTDDGRIKPDVVANGINVLSSIATSDNAYDVYSGTSMATPSASGSLLLLQEYYSQLHPPGFFMRSATLKAIIIHTADEAGPSPGPDYQHGWGLINMQKAAAVITANNTTHLINENVLNTGSTFSLPVVASGNGTITATIVWTDPKAQVEPVGSALNNSTRKLVKDLDIVIRKGATTYRPWILNPAAPASAATRGDNTRDNVEKVELTDVIPGETYTIEITHKGILERGSQAYSLIVSGVGGQAFCASAPGSTTGARIDSVSFGNIQNKNVAGCTGYSNFTNLTFNVQPGQSFPFFIRLNSCDATAVNKTFKVYIDVNNDGDFTDAGETLINGIVINGDGTYSDPALTMPAGLIPGRYTIMRIVMQETGTAADVSPCGAYAKGETQDYRVFLTVPSKDVGISELVAPIQGNCGSGAQYVVVRIRNFGNSPQSNIPVSTVIKQGATTIATINGLFPGTIPANASVAYVMQTPFVAAANTSYTITSTTSLTGDQSLANNENITTLTTSPNTTDPAGTAVICNTQAILKATPAAGSVFSWYSAAAATTPITVGANTNTTTIVPTYYLAKNPNDFTIGPANKNVFPSGGYSEFQGNFVEFNTAVPLTIETVKLYIGNSNSTGKLNFILGRNFSYNSATNQYSYLPEAVATVDIYTTDPTPQPGGQTNDPTDQGAVFYLNLPITVTGNHILIINNPNDNDLTSIFRNNNISSNPYPIGIPGLFTFTGNSASYSTPPNNFQAFYYFFYDMKLKLAACPSGRTAITATTAVAPTITIAGNVLTSSATTGNQWLADGIAIPGETNSTYTATAAGNYSTQVTDAGGCTLTSNVINFTATAVPNIDPAQIGLTVAPVPTKGDFTMKLEVRTKADLDISLMNTTGQRVYHSAIPDFIGQLTKTVSPGKLAAGIYYLQIIHDKKMYVRKIVIVE
jgi:hypothetical protein